MREKLWRSLFLLLVVPTILCCDGQRFHFDGSLTADIERTWIGREYWANRLQDWRLKDGRIECVDGTLPLRTVHLLTRELSPEAGDVEMRVRIGLVSAAAGLDRTAWSGFLIGAGGVNLDYRARSLVHLGSGTGGGLIAALDGEGHLAFYDNSAGLRYLKPETVSAGIRKCRRTECQKSALHQDVVTR